MKRGDSPLIVSVLAIFVLLFSALASAAEPAAKRNAEAQLVRIEQVEVRSSLVGPVVLLKVQGKAIPVFVDAVVAQSIAGALGGEKFPRPLSHDLMKTILEAYDGKVSQVVITLKERTFHADLTVLMRGATKVFDSRSSDAIALAIHFKAPMLVSQDLVDKAGTSLEEPQREPRPGEVRL